MLMTCAQISSGYFVPPVAGLYQFSTFCGSNEFGDSYVLLASGADPAGAYVVAHGNHFNDQVHSRWLPLEPGKLYYIEFWQVRRCNAPCTRRCRWRAQSWDSRPPPPPRV